MNLRPFQSAAVDKLRASFAAGKRAPVLVAPPGSGKTVMAAMCAAAHLDRRPANRMWWGAHRRELVQQAMATLERCGCDMARVSVGSYQTAVARGEVPDCTLAVLDEAHHAPADTYATIVEALRGRGVPMLGLTATPERGDGRPLGPDFDDIVVAAQVGELIAMGLLVPPDIVRPERKVPRGKIAMHPVDAHLRFANGKRNVVFCPNVAAAREWRHRADAVGISSRIVIGEMSPLDRFRAFYDFRCGTVRMLFNVAIATEGTDIPEIEAVTLARPIGHTGLFLQMAGRGARPAPGKASYKLIDLVGAVDAHGSPAEDCTYSLDGLPISIGGRSVVAQERLCKLCKAPLDDMLVCSRCGRDHALAPPTVAEIAMVKWEGKRREDTAGRAAQLARWFAKFPGKREYFYIMLYKHVYSVSPTPEIWQEAKRICAA